MKNIVILLLVIPFVSHSQVTLKEKGISKYLDFVNNTMKGVSVAEAVNLAKIALYNDLYSGSAIGSEDFYKAGDGSYVYEIKNEKVGFYLGINGIGQFFSQIYIFAIEPDLNKKDNIITIMTNLEFMRRYASDSTMLELGAEFKISLNNYYINKCATGLINHKIGTQIKRMGLQIEDESFHSYDVWGSKLVKEVESNKDKCISDCESCSINFEYGFSHGAPGLSSSYSHVFFIGATNKFIEPMFALKKEMYEYNFKIYDSQTNKFNKDLREINNYDLNAMVNFFLEDCKQNDIKITKTNNLKATFSALEGETIARSYGFKDDSKILIKVDPEKWAKSSAEKRWYVLYHELGHDVLNLEHGEGGKMMFNFADKDYSWDDFISDKKYMLDNYTKSNKR